MSVDYKAYVEHLLEETMKNGATDLHICVGSRPLIRVNSQLRPVVDTEIIKPDAIIGIAGEYLDYKKLEILEKNKSVDLSYSVPRLGRFRCNFYYQRGTVAIAIS
jgi:twitching motility protein PilT